MHKRTVGALFTLTAGMSILAMSYAQAEGLVLNGASSSNRSQLFSNQTSILDSRASSQYSHSGRLKPETKTRSVASNANIPSYSGNYRGQFMPMARAAAQRHNIPTDLFLRLVQQESGWNPNAASHAGARGLAQLMPATAAKMGVRDITDPRQNLEGGARYLRLMYDRFGNWRHALAAYNAGPQAVAKYNGVPPYRETRNYVAVILGS